MGYGRMDSSGNGSRRSMERRSMERNGNSSSRSGRSRVRFRSEHNLVAIRELPARECDDARMARRGTWRSAPEDDPLWDGDTRSFRERELSVDELAEYMKRKRKSKKKGISLLSLFGQPNYRKQVEQDLAEQGTYRVDRDEYDEEEENASYVEYMTDSDNEDNRHHEKPKRHSKPLKSALKRGSRHPTSFTDSIHQGQVAIDRTVRAYRDSMKQYAARKRRYRRRRKLEDSTEISYFTIAATITTSFFVIFLYRFFKLALTPSDHYVLEVSGVVLLGLGFVGLTVYVLNYLFPEDTNGSNGKKKRRKSKRNSQQPVDPMFDDQGKQLNDLSAVIPEEEQRKTST